MDAGRLTTGDHCGSCGATIRLASDDYFPAGKLIANVPKPCGSCGATIRLASDEAGTFKIYVD